MGPQENPYAPNPMIGGWSGNSQNPMQNPYMRPPIQQPAPNLSQISQQQNPQPQMQRPTVLPGRFIENDNEVRPNEVPMDGSISVFPKRDLSAVILKSWNSNGTIDSVRYVLDIPIQEDPKPDSFQQEIFSRLDKIEELLVGKKSSSKVKKEEE